MSAKLAAAGLAAVLALPVLVAAGIAGLTATSRDAPTATPGCAPTGEHPPVPGFTTEQLDNAAVIVAVGARRGIPHRGRLIALAAAIQESSLRNLPYGDRDSLGLYQQRPSMGWGDPDDLTDPTYAATTFYKHLTDTPDWQHMSLTDAAQHVQGSATPHAYAAHERSARTILTALDQSRCRDSGTGSCEHIDAPTRTAATAINYACGQRGLPYQWGGNGPRHGDAGFDCSGLTTAAYAATGITLPRTAQTQFDTGHPVPAGQPLLPGDLVFYGTPTTIHHVGLYLGHGRMINAPDFGLPVRVQNYRHPGDDYAGATRPSI